MAELRDAPFNQTPWPLWVFGEEPAGVPELYLSESTDEEDLARVRGLFPEARVSRMVQESPSPDSFE